MQSLFRFGPDLALLKTSRTGTGTFLVKNVATVHMTWSGGLNIYSIASLASLRESLVLLVSKDGSSLGAKMTIRCVHAAARTSFVSLRASRLLRQILVLLVSKDGSSLGTNCVPDTIWCSHVHVVAQDDEGIV